MRALIGLSLLGVALALPPVSTSGSGADWSDAVTQVCAHALLFEGRHQIGTRAGALAVARDIRASTARRLHRIEALPQTPANSRLAARWIANQRQLAAMLATDYVRVFDVIAAANTPSKEARMAARLIKLEHAPDGL